MEATAAELLIGMAILAAAIGIGGGLYEFVVLDPVWPNRPALVQPMHGGVSRKRFWIPAHIVFELLLVAALVAAWGAPGISRWLLIALATHAAMRIWSALDFIPKALAFERDEADSVSPDAARRWTRRSRLRLPLDLAKLAALLAAFWTAARSAGI
ncbi:hypothetical protein [Bosea vaviloviae]|uniref:DUF1772 domain-containing protein n=1 Tax=Bosea vaviloviae TaxID=1526658 RepID=A0A1D7U645_9HYPH|nr:hypothetical protein [Bosea vaviloviae]AOO82802.1 hypothetical protein BHK69_22320 [Bosea vaviloviae]